MLNKELVMGDVNIEIIYCQEWDFLPQASSLAAAIEGRYGIKSELIKGGNGIFTVKINGKIAYNNRKKGGRFPENNEIFMELDRLAPPLIKGERKGIESGTGADSPSCNWSPEK